MNLLLQNIFYGHELPRLEEGSSHLRQWIEQTWPKVDDVSPPNIDWPALYSHIRKFFKRPRPGLFDGPITAGDGLVIAAFMAAIRPASMIEIGTASGFSSAFTLETARAFGLTDEGKRFLYSIDIAASRDTGDRTGQLLAQHYPELLSLWKLHAPATSLDILRKSLSLPIKGPAIAFIDGGHTHPWPVADIIAMTRMLPRGSWVLLQDVQIMERWIADCILYGAPSPAPVRGAQLAVSLWPGTKWIGQNMCYNMAALKLDADDESVSHFITNALTYTDEGPFEGRDLLALEAQGRL